jgi:hypothetical protein
MAGLFFFSRKLLNRKFTYLYNNAESCRHCAKPRNVITHFITNCNLRTIKKILLAVFFIAFIGMVIISDIFDRGQYYSTYTPKEETIEFFMRETSEEQEKVFEKNFGNEKYSFPRQEVAEVKLFRNRFLLSRLTSKTLSNSSKTELISFFNNPVNFDWGETTWEVAESEYILRFYNKEDKEIGKIWLCLEGCGMTKSIPFSPNMKYGGLSESGKEGVEKIINTILTE